MDSILKPGYGLAGRIDRALMLNPEPLFPYGTDEYWMEQTLLESMNSIGLSQPNPSVGCVLTKDSAVIAKGFTQAYRHEHAERNAFSKIPIGTDLSDVTAYVSLEPCSHFGYQPPCVDLLLNSSIPRVVIAVLDPDPRVNGEGIQKLRAAGKEVKVSVLEREAWALNFPFFKTRSRKKPVWIGKWAQTPSGHLADAHGNSKWITGPKSRAYTHWLRQKYDCIVVGARTFMADHPLLTVRDCALPHHRNPERVVFDPRGRLLGFPLERVSGFRVLVCQSVLEARGEYDPDVFWPIRSKPDSPALIPAFQEALEALSFSRPLQSIMVEGGAALLNGLLRAEALDAAHLFTGAKTFSETSDLHLIHWNPDSKWSCATRHDFDHDHLQEWVKED